MDIWQSLKLEKRPILLYGGGDGAKKIYNELTKNQIKVSGIFASDGFKRVRRFEEFEIIPYSVALERFGSFLSLFAFGSNNQEVLCFARELGLAGKMLCAEMPVCGDMPFNEAFARKNKALLKAVYDMLADSQSKKVFKETLLFKLDGNINRLFSCETDENEAFENILKLKDGSSFLDLGAYNGDTVLDFVKRVKKFSHITAIEPDKKSFTKLLKNTESFSVDCINAAVGETNGEIPFTFKASRGSVYGGNELCRSITVDSLNKSFDYIKFDVEGEELKTIKGAANTISRYKPKMLISCYHRIEDYFAIPLEVMKLNPDYKLYMRHHPYIPAWDTNFYFV